MSPCSSADLNALLSTRLITKLCKPKGMCRTGFTSCRGSLGSKERGLASSILGDTPHAMVIRPFCEGRQDMLFKTYGAKHDAQTISR